MFVTNSKFATNVKYVLIFTNEHCIIHFNKAKLKLYKL